jgi:acyl-CoA reductase-like NAD-dependent aldehyde dehydrogenase
VVNVVTGDAAQSVAIGKALCSSPIVRHLSFTGSTEVGRILMAQCAPTIKKLSLELGGKNPGIIFEDCDWETMMKRTIHSAFSNQGEICLCTSRLLIQRSIYEKFKADFVSRTKALGVGNPLQKTSFNGAIVSKAHFDKILNCCIH